VKAHYTHENAHRLMRDRYGTVGADRSNTLRRRGLDAQRLRAAASIFLNWLKLCLRHGIIGEHARRVKSEIHFLDGRAASVVPPNSV
jgi:hypothetical protein